ncbi:hypothetical protein WG66_009435 [Moniliophthora roreri]|nr:hypothetical protein WG66_009435 [Moniliophthora roreri]
MPLPCVFSPVSSGLWSRNTYPESESRTLNIRCGDTFTIFTYEFHTKPGRAELLIRKESHSRSVMGEVNRYDDDVVKNWKDEIDTLLVYASLFSAVVTAFAIESYQWLTDDPADVTVALLTQVSLQLSGTNTSQIQLLRNVPLRVEPSSWLREYQRDIPTRTQAEALGLRQLWSESPEKWGVPAFLAVLPILLEAVLLPFLAGLLDPLWARHPVPFALTVVAVGISAGLYFITTFRLSGRPSHGYLFTKAGLWIQIKYPAPDWSTFGLEVTRRFNENIFSLSETGAGILKLYELRGLRWAVSMFRYSPSMIPHLQNVMSALQPSVALSAVLNCWQLTTWSDVTSVDVMEALKDDAVFKNTVTDGLVQYPFFARSPDIQHPALLSPNVLSESISEFERSGAYQITKMQFFLLFPVADRLWTYLTPLSEDAACSLYWFTPNHGKLYSTTKEDEDTFEPRFDERPASILALARHLTRADCVSELLVPEEGRRFIKFIHDEIIRCQLYQPRDWWNTVKMWKMLVLEWNHVIERAT